MQWDGSKYGGFLQKTWLPVNQIKIRLNVDIEFNNQDSVYHYYKKILKLRKRHDIIVYGTYILLEEMHEQLYVYKRQWEDEELLVICNFFRRKP